MPRKARIDAPGALHHIIARGIERGKIFKDDLDRNNFLERFGTIVLETDTRCYAWALIPNHFHLLLKTGGVPIATVMRRLLTGYAGFYNRRYRRTGHLFQNRYKSILCQEDVYLKEKLRYSRKAMNAFWVTANLLKECYRLPRSNWKENMR
jgi:putative transposase